MASDKKFSTKLPFSRTHCPSLIRMALIMVSRLQVTGEPRRAEQVVWTALGKTEQYTLGVLGLHALGPRTVIGSFRGSGLSDPHPNKRQAAFGTILKATILGG